MGRIIFDTATTLNGWIADDENSLDWLFAVDGSGIPDGALGPPDAAVMVEGSSTYEWVVEKEHILDQPEKWRQFYGDKPTFVLTTRVLPRHRETVEFCSGSLASLVNERLRPRFRHVDLR